MVPLQPLPLVVVQGVLQLVSVGPRGPRTLRAGLGDSDAFAPGARRARSALEPSSEQPPKSTSHSPPNVLLVSLSFPFFLFIFNFFFSYFILMKGVCLCSPRLGMRDSGCPGDAPGAAAELENRDGRDVCVCTPSIAETARSRKVFCCL